MEGAIFHLWFSRREQLCVRETCGGGLTSKVRTLSPTQAQQQAQEELAEMAAASQEPVTLSTLKQDSLMIPVARMSHFFPAGHPVRTRLATIHFRPCPS